MQSPEEFMAAFFRAREEEMKLEFECGIPFRSRYFEPGCTHGGKLMLFEHDEVVLSTLNCETHAEVVTRQQGWIVLRYRLVPAGESWLIKEYPVDVSQTLKFTNREQIQKAIEAMRLNQRPG